MKVEMWYIKDAGHRYVDANINFLSHFLHDGLASVIGLDDRDISIASGRDINLMHDFETHAIVHKKNVTLFSYGYMCNKDKVKSFVINIKPLALSNESMIMVLISELSCMNHSVDWLSKVLRIDSLPNTERLLPSYENDDPRLILTENEWEVSWLLICGFSIRGIAKYLNVSTKTVQVRASSAYMNLRVYDKCGLLKVAEKYNWVNFVPESFLALPALIRIS
ncbi:LuxR C-terminal-related transcriptional regulator [Pantoea stewartii]|uniref:LuxR C-terminal-related transcriptional regulator n=2 Tax=Pantoea stewartii TaxID=66269 RepID=UPI0005C5D464|nr:response regulator transcription factor [Pantoea stewartii subsp. stewartii]